MINTNRPSPLMIADAMIDFLTSNRTFDRASMIAYADSIPNRDSLRNALADAIDADIRDLIHNANIDFLTDDEFLDSLDNDEFDSLARFILDTCDCTMIADMILARFL